MLASGSTVPSAELRWGCNLLVIPQIGAVSGWWAQPGAPDRRCAWVREVGMVEVRWKEMGGV